MAIVDTIKGFRWGTKDELFDKKGLLFMQAFLIIKNERGKKKRTKYMVVTEVFLKKMF